MEDDDDDEDWCGDEDAAGPYGRVATLKLGGTAAAMAAAVAAAAAAANESLTREQRVARYRLKRKNRQFKKTIRYASRKAYAEVRPRIKGRFVKKEELESWRDAGRAMEMAAVAAGGGEGAEGRAEARGDGVGLVPVM